MGYERSPALLLRGAAARSGLLDPVAVEDEVGVVPGVVLRVVDGLLGAGVVDGEARGRLLAEAGEEVAEVAAGLEGGEPVGDAVAGGGFKFFCKIEVVLNGRIRLSSAKRCVVRSPISMEFSDT